jgi:hypothetical protein
MLAILPIHFAMMIKGVGIGRPNLEPAQVTALHAGLKDLLMPHDLHK